MIVDGYLAGLSAGLWLIGATGGVLTFAAPWAAGGWLLVRAARSLGRTRAVWRIRGRLAVHRMRGSGP